MWRRRTKARLLKFNSIFLHLQKRRRHQGGGGAAAIFSGSREEEGPADPVVRLAVVGCAVCDSTNLAARNAQVCELAIR